MIRLARAGEALQLQAICWAADQAFVEVDRPELANDPFPLPALQRGIAAGRVLAAVDDADCPIGWLLLGFGGAEPCIGQVAVSPAHGRCGIGAALMEQAHDLARQRGSTTMILNTERDVEWNAPWYAKLGYVVVDPSEWTNDMRSITAEHIADGLDWSRRVHMRTALLPSCT